MRLALRVAVVGGGIAGLLTALKLVKVSDAEVTVFEEHVTVGKPVHCAGIVSDWTVQALRKSVRVDVLKSFSSLKLVVGRVEVELRGRLDKCAVVDRERLDLSAYEEAVKRGVKVELNCAVELVQGSGRVFAGGRWRNFDGVIVADGMRGFMKRGARPLLGVQYEIKAPHDVETIELWLDKRINKDFFAWFVPTDETVLAGTASRSPLTHELLNAFCRRRLSSWRILNKRVGFVNVSGPVSKFVGERAVLIGDAAGQNKPTTGGGIFMIELASSMLAEALANSQPRDVPQSLLAYEHRWRRLMFKDMLFMQAARRAFSALTQEQLERAAALLSSYEPSFLLNADMDKQSTLFYTLLKRPALLARLLRLMVRPLTEGVALLRKPA